MIIRISNIITPLVLTIALSITGCSEDKAPVIGKARVPKTPTTQECSFFNDGACINDNEELEIYKSYARIDENTQDYVVLLRGWIYQSSIIDTRSVFLTLLEGQIDSPPARPANINSRIDPFLVDNQSGEVIKVAIGSKVYALDPSLSSGFLSGEIHISSQQAEAIFDKQGNDTYISYRVLLPADEKREFKGKIDVVSNDGIIVVSDIDDTIKISEVYISESRLLENIFYKEERSVPDMSTFLQTLENENESPLFFYVSGSPKQMNKSLTNFLDEKEFPKGYIYLKDFQVTTISSFLDTNSTYEHKLKNIRALFKEFPRREFILIGDSGEKDPEVYGKLFEEYSSRIKSIHIRNVTSETLDNVRFKNIFPISIDKVTLIEANI